MSKNMLKNEINRDAVKQDKGVGGRIDSQEFMLVLQQQVQQQIQLDQKQLLPTSLSPRLGPLLQLIARHPWQFLLALSGLQALFVELFTY